jgi:tripartite-type tricarboxylate transporter receptor subunit TctC
MKEDKTMQMIIRVGKLMFYLWLVSSLSPYSGIEPLHAQNYPAKPINVVIPLGPGGANDLVARAMSPLASEYLGQPFVIHFRPGGGGAIGSNEVATANPDGYTVLFGHANCNSVLPAVKGQGKGPGGLEPIARISESYNAYWVLTGAPWKTFKEVIAWAKANPGKLTAAQSGMWSSSDFQWRWLELNAGFTSRSVPYDGGAKALVALLGGHVQIARQSPPQSFPHWRAGTIRPLVVSGNNRIDEMPDVPCLLEEGYDMKGLGSNWNGFFAPNGTPKPVINKLAEGLKKMTNDKRAIAALKAMGSDFAYLGPEEFDKAWREEFNAYKELAKIFKQ